MMNSFNGMASARIFATLPEIPALDAASSRPPSADRIHDSRSRPCRRACIPAIDAEANKARIAELTTTRIKLVRWMT